MELGENCEAAPAYHEPSYLNRTGLLSEGFLSASDIRPKRTSCSSRGFLRWSEGGGMMIRKPEASHEVLFLVPLEAAYQDVQAHLTVC